MKREKTVLLPKLTYILEEMGENIKLARLRRKFFLSNIPMYGWNPIMHTF